MTTKAKPQTADRDELDDELDDDDDDELADDDDDELDDDDDDADELGAGFTPEALEAEQRRHEAALRDLLGDAFDDLTACDKCGGMGVYPASIEPAPDPVADPDLVRCDACNGYGARTTPSLASGYETVACTVCSGTGYRSQAQVDALRAAEAYQAQAAQAIAPPPMGTPPTPYYDQARGQWMTPDGQPIYVPPAPGS